MTKPPRPRVPFGNPDLPTTSLGRWLRVVTDGLVYGPPSAAINYFASSPTLVDPEAVWTFFTQLRTAPVQYVTDHYPVAPVRRRIITRMMHQAHSDGIEYHYDLSNDFYRLFLDREFMFYTCADFHSPTDTIEQAQRNKADHLLSLIEPKAGEAIMEMGCGWGSMLRHIHAATGDKGNLWGYTLSREQKAHIEQNFGFNVLLEDFTTADMGESRYDKIYSIGALEHVRPDEILPLLRTCRRALKPGGRLVQHFFSLNGTDPMPTSMIAAQLPFPGSLLSLHSHHLAMVQEAGFRLTHDSLHDYRPTLRAWFDRLVESRDEAIALVGVEHVNKYLAFFASSWAFFNLRQATLHRLVMERD
ncbi:class I SAM-dependent methyltransferase [Phreatobacter aquaticus]|uniref:class I SAM-dependent methyltransferase n=1 Tax=Phreatobacter aquaticus TaxID=2570229 RepID=UPI00143D9D4D|nr:class I SAM-dependent methyltransferase [Phreatobacter aquaticus]